ncbi:hypothetical protein FB451DRAFT_1136338 [Mycena latifolia]|nr:hypothetical protein FB451DRAFT_1136338 [Mycena latifolia]
MTDVLGTVATAIQLIDAALKAREYVKDFYNAPAEQKRLFVELNDLDLLLKELQKRVTASPSASVLQNMTAPLDRFKNILEKFMTKFEDPNGRRSRLSKQLTWSLWNKKEAKDYLVEFESAKSLLSTWLTLEIWDAGQKHDESHHAILAVFAKQGREQQERNKAMEGQEILDWITPLNFFQRQEDIFSSWQPGTGEWLLSDPQFRNWASGSQEILWCQGISGAGKTVLSSVVVNHLRSQFPTGDPGIACIYLNHKETEVQTPLNLLASVWKQLVVDTSISPAVHQLYSHHRSRDIRPSLAEVFGILQSTVGQHSKVYIIVDALDECPEDQQTILLEHLSMLRGANTRLMFTSRPHVTLEEFFPSLLGLEIHATEDDLRKYVDRQILKSSRLTKHVRTRPDLHEEIKLKITSNAHGMFLLAKLHMESLATKNTVKAVREALQHLPSSINQTYDEAMDRIKSQNEDDKQLALQALIWVAYAKRPLFVGEFSEALAIETDATTLDLDNLLDIGIVVSLCAGLIIVDQTMCVVRLIHNTTQSYFDHIQPLQFADAHTIIASQCFIYLSFDEFSNIEFDWESPKDPSDHAREWTQAHPLMAYSQYVLLHAAEASGQLDLQHTLESFLPRTEAWKEFWTILFRWDELVAPWSYWEWMSSPSLLWISVASNLLQITSHLLAQGGDVSLNSALSVAVFYGYTEMAELLITLGADVNAQAGPYGGPLQVGSRHGHNEIVNLLIDKGAKVNAEEGGYGTALLAASATGHESVVRLLIERGADVHAGGRYGAALQVATAMGHTQVVCLLMDYLEQDS